VLVNKHLITTTFILKVELQSDPRYSTEPKLDHEELHDCSSAEKPQDQQVYLMDRCRLPCHIKLKALNYINETTWVWNRLLGIHSFFSF